jgi:1-acyl-sn-glycerol-3-phosphate acyltransferase
VIGRALARRSAERLIRRDLRRTFRRVVWLGPAPALPEAPVVLYANHHGFHDGYLLWLLVIHHLGRPVVLWMERWNQAPLFGPLGALPFPPDDPRARTATIRETIRRMKSDPRTVLIVFPEGALGPPDAGLAPFRADLPRLARLLPEATRWWPVALRATWWGEARPTALLTGSPLHGTPDDQEPERLQTLLAHLHATRPDDLQKEAYVLLDGGPDPHERWDLSALASLFRRWT